jgi:UDP-3-O-[3-hydroxymyristoyl] glucosamine N-acyltransferase
MKKFNTHLTPPKIAAKLAVKAHITEDYYLNNVSELANADQHSVCFYENPKFLDDLKNSKAGLIFVANDFDITQKASTNLIFCEKPYLYFMMLVRFWLELDKSAPHSQIDPNVILPDSVILGRNVLIARNCTVGEESQIGDNTIIQSNTAIGKNVRIGSGCYIYPNVSIYDDSIIGDNVILHSGCVIGSDGFGYILHNNLQNKIPQVGNVIIGDDVEIGANTCVDRATLGSTIIKKGAKIDNLVQIGHNCVIGEHSIICAQVGLAGSTEIGDFVYLAGQVGVAGHLKIDNGVMVGAQSGVSHSLQAGEKVFGTPAIDAGLRKRIIVCEKNLPELVKYYRKNLKERK